MLKIPKVSKWLQLSKALLPLKTTKKVTEGSPCCEDVRTVQLCPLLLCPTSALIKAKLQNIGGRLMGSEGAPVNGGAPPCRRNLWRRRATRGSEAWSTLERSDEAFVLEVKLWKKQHLKGPPLLHAKQRHEDRKRNQIKVLEGSKERK